MSEISKRLRDMASESRMVRWEFLLETAKEIEALEAKVKELELDKQRAIEMLKKKLDFIKCGIATNYSGNPYEDKRYIEVFNLVNELTTDKGNG